MVGLLILSKSRGRVFAAGALSALLLVFASCSTDVPGLFGSRDFEERQGNRNHLAYLDEKYLHIKTGDSYSFLVLSDVHIEDADDHGLSRLSGALGESDAFVVIVGDVTQSGKRGDIRKFLSFAAQVAEEHDKPVFPVIGNHDVYFGAWPHWKALIGSSTYRIDTDAARLIVLDTANATLGASQTAWLEDQLRGPKDRVFIFSHANLFTETPEDWQQLTDVRERARLLSMLKGRCDAMFMGHVHKRIIETVGGVRYITLEDFKSHGTYCRVKVSPGGISWEFCQL